MNGTAPSQGAGGGGGGGSWGGAGAGAGAAAGGGRPTLDQILFMGLGSSPQRMTSWTAIGAVAVALVVGTILMDTARYFDYFNDTDKKWVRGGVALGSFASFGQLIISCVQTWSLAHHAFTDFHTISWLDSVLGNISDLMGALLNFAASSYYTYRAFKMSGEKWWLGVGLMVLNTATLVMGSTVAIKGMTAPRVTMETAMTLKAFQVSMSPLRKSWGALAMTSDSLVCGVMMFFLFKSRSSVFHREHKIYHKLNTLIIETMLPPVICILLLDIYSDSKTSPTADWRKVLRMLLPCLYYVSLLHSLVSRATIRQMLDDRLASEGVHHTSGSRSNGGGSVFIASYPRKDTDNKHTHLEASTDHIVQLPLEKLQSQNRSASPVSDASSKRKVNQNRF